MKWTLLFILSVLATNAYSLDYPKMPNPELTPGSLCDRPDTYRYPEHIAYCERDVTSHLKAEIFASYRNHLGYTLDLSNRSNYKIDHYIPLCAGGSNEEDNLWPQHISVFTITDPIESVGCEVLSAGKITQKELVSLIKQAKLNLTDAPKVLKRLQALKK